ncbi:pyruvate decarboxylase [Aaosphaeria arxii CBS 175.79]|uniref:Pyruvate decarboxylase n=1 Tax=Aaosphaeria arxii CBS 175.79 TaxID=1450172 RepID=A0A6A5X8A2_9PLEO|nr:pyruvate decarboxylase [Aaosphaeria arxii CBS 175.79]KAF2009178.1 pyruvate decarboxylase [Aaosphaeria arxii CBS 175.79]
MTVSKIPLSRYLWERIHQLGVDSIFGVPGDFNLQTLDTIYDVKGLSWVGNQNELNAAYAADGYARIKKVPGVFVTTHGVGELSALNGVAGAYSERVKMIHVVGQTPRPMQERNMMIHHSIGNKPDHQLYNQASRDLRLTAAELWDIETAPAEIDRVIRECIVQSGPVYIFIPLDLGAEEVSADLLDTPLDLTPKIDEKAQIAAVEVILSALSAAKNPAVFIDALVDRFNGNEEAQELVSKLNVPFYCANMGKAIVDETHEKYVGVWNGVVSTPGLDRAAKEADLMITLGYLPADTNSGAFSRKLDDKTTIHIDPFEVVVKGEVYPNLHIKPFLNALIKALPSQPTHNIPNPKADFPQLRVPLDKDASHVTQSWLWPQFESFLQPGDVVIGETGTATFGLCDISFPPNVRFHTQTYYGSIGWATAATLGMEIARRELDGEDLGRTILVTGDGSMAMTIQEVGTMIKHGIKPIIFVINNAGYTIERVIWGAHQPYNDIVPTAYSHLLPLFHHPSPTTSFHIGRTKDEMARVFSSKTLAKPTVLQLAEIVVEKLDSSWRLPALLAWRGGDKHKQFLTEAGIVDTYGGWGLNELEGGNGNGVNGTNGVVNGKS